jgi:hypothetical protein
MRHLAACLVLLYSVGSSHAGTVSGTFQGIADIEVQQIVLGQQVGSTVTYSAVPSTLDFTITSTNPSLYAGTLQFSLDNNIFSLNTATLLSPPNNNPQYAVLILDGTPGQSGDAAYGSVFSLAYHLWSLEAGVGLTDLTGQYIGPNGNGDPSNAQVTAKYVYEPWNNEDTGQTYTVTFTTVVPEPSSIVMATSGALLVLAAALGRARRACHLRAPA